MKKSSFALIVESMRKNAMSDTEILDTLIDFSDMVNNPQMLYVTKIPEEEKIKLVLEEVWMSPRYEGYTLWVEAVQMYINSKRTLEIGVIYNELGNRHSKTYSGIASTMLRTVQRTFEKCPEEIARRVFSGSECVWEGRAPTSKEFLSCIANKVLQQN